MKLTLAHSPDADDAFMFYGLSSGGVDTGGVVIEHQLKDIQSLNEWALSGKYEVSAISFHAYPEVQEKYALLTTGACFGESNYGPVLVKRPSPLPPGTRYQVVGVPGTKTTAFLLLKLWNPKLEFKTIPFDRILQAVVDKSVDAGLIIHEGQLFYQQMGLEEVVNFGRWWHQQYHLPLPLGGIAVRRDLAPTLQKKIAKWVRASIEYGLAHREAALDYALKFSRDLPTQKADQFVGMYVNERTVEMGEEGKKAVQLLLDLGYEKKIISKRANLDWVA